jgi:hypothetical protein
MDVNNEPVIDLEFFESMIGFFSLVKMTGDYNISYRVDERSAANA